MLEFLLVILARFAHYLKFFAQIFYYASIRHEARHQVLEVVHLVSIEEDCIEKTMEVKSKHIDPNVFHISLLSRFQCLSYNFNDPSEFYEAFLVIFFFVRCLPLALKQLLVVAEAVHFEEVSKEELHILKVELIIEVTLLSVTFYLYNFVWVCYGDRPVCVIYEPEHSVLNRACGGIKRLLLSTFLYLKFCLRDQSATNDMHVPAQYLVSLKGQLEFRPTHQHVNCELFIGSAVTIHD